MHLPRLPTLQTLSTPERRGVSGISTISRPTARFLFFASPFVSIKKSHKGNYGQLKTTDRNFLAPEVFLLIFPGSVTPSAWLRVACAPVALSWKREQEKRGCLRADLRRAHPPPRSSPRSRALSGRINLGIELQSRKRGSIGRACVQIHHR